MLPEPVPIPFHPAIPLTPFSSGIGDAPLQYRPPANKEDHPLLPFNFCETAPSYDTAEVFLVRIDPEIGNSPELLRALYYGLWFPGYFGFNWSALGDCLQDLSWIPSSTVVIVHEGLPALPRDELKVYLQILGDAVLSWAADEARDLQVVFPAPASAVIERVLAPAAESAA